jgi:hypothetical protein
MLAMRRAASLPSDLAWTAALLAAAMLAGATAARAAAPPQLVAIRVGIHPGFTRVVLELDAQGAYSIGGPEGERGERELVVELTANGPPRAVTSTSDLVESVRSEPGASGVRVHIRLRDGGTPRLFELLLSDPPRIVLDLRREGAAETSAVETGVRGAAAGRVAADDADPSAPPPGGEAPRTPEPAAHETAAERKRRLTERPDEERPEEQLAIPIFGRPLTIGGEIETRLDYERDAALGTRDDDRGRFVPSVELELFYPASESISLFGEMKYAFDWNFYREGGGERNEHRLRRGESWLLLEDVWDSAFSFDVGRLNFRDERRWWWDDDLDAARMSFEDFGVRIDAAIAQELAPEDLREGRIDPEHEDVLRILCSAHWRYARRHELELFALRQDDHSQTEAANSIVRANREDESDADLTWLGLRAMGRWKLDELGRLYYWLGGAALRGEETLLDFDDAEPGASVVESVSTHDVAGWATDLGLVWETALPAHPSLSLGYAFGSGDGDPDGDAFRQTGLQRNDDAFRGVNAFRYYGELLDPELSNLHVVTAALGVPLGPSNSAELVYHYYRQARASELLRARGIRIDPDGDHPSIGHALDLVLGFEAWRNRRLELVGSLFRAGAAYGEGHGEFAFGGRATLEVVF